MNSRPRLIADASLPYIAGVLEPHASIIYLPSQEITRERLIKERANGLLIRSVTKCNSQLLDGTDIEFIATATAGFDHIDAAYCRAHSIHWNNAPGCNAAGVAHWVLCALAQNALHIGKPMREECLGIIGVGNVGKKLQSYAKTLGIRTFLCDPPRAEREGGKEFYPLEVLAKECSLLSLHTPLTKEGEYPTYHLVDRGFLAQCQQRPLIINAARGAVVSTEALLTAYDAQQISGLMIDCWEREPHISQELLSRAKRATPHIAGFSAEGKARGSRMVLESVIQYFDLTEIDLSDVQAPLCSLPPIEYDERDALWVENIYAATDEIMRTAEQRLRNAPAQFEQHRVDYPFHRESSSFSVHSKAPIQQSILKELGFKIL